MYVPIYIHIHSHIYTYGGIDSYVCADSGRASLVLSSGLTFFDLSAKLRRAGEAPSGGSLVPAESVVQQLTGAC